MLSGNFAEMTTSTPFRGLLRAANLRHGTDGLYFLSEGRRAEDFFALKNPTALAGFLPANLGTKGQHDFGFIKNVSLASAAITSVPYRTTNYTQKIKTNRC